MARRIPAADAKARPRAKPPVETGDETVVSMPPPEHIYEVPVLDEVQPASAPSAWPSPVSPRSGSTESEGTRVSRVEPGSEPMATQSGLPGWREGCWKVFGVLAGLFLLSVIVQVYLAGASVFGAVSSIQYHKDFVHAVEILSFLMVIFAFLGGRKAAGWWSVGIVIAVEIQYGLASIKALDPPPSQALLAIAALHVVNALFIFGAAMMILHKYVMRRRMVHA